MSCSSCRTVLSLSFSLILRFADSIWVREHFAATATADDVNVVDDDDDEDQQQESLMKAGVHSTL